MKAFHSFSKLTFLAFLLFSVSIWGQVPASGATDVSITTTYTIPSGSPGTLSDATSYDLVILNSAGNAQYGTATTFTYSNAIGNTVSGPTLVNYTDYQWQIVIAGENAVTPPSGVKYGPFAFTTIGPTLTLSGGGVNIAEDGGTTDLTITASAPIGKDLAVTITYTGTVNNSVYGTDFTNSGGANPETVTIIAGNTTQTTTLTGVADTFLEGDETIIGTITSVVSGVIGGTAQTVTITDAEFIDIVAQNSTIAESGGTTGFYAQISGGGTNETGGAVTVNLDWTQGSAVSGTDFTGAADVTITSGSISSPIASISITSDNLYEGDENIGVKITGLTGAPTGTGFAVTTATTTITDDETISISRDNTNIAEDGTSAVTFTATVDGGGNVVNGDVTLTMTWTGTASSGTDYTGAGDITITNGTSSGSVALTSAADTSPELDETIIGTASSPTYGSLSTTTSATSTIIDNETVLSSPADAATGQALNVALSWSAVAGADQYKLYVNTSNTFGSGTAVIDGVDQGNVTSKAPGGLQDNTTYYWKVVPRNTSSSDTRVASTTEIRSFTTSQQSVTGISPTDAAYDVALNPTLSWPATTGADKYRLEVNTASNFAGTVIFDDATLTTNSQALSGLTYNTTYYWRVTAYSNLLAPSSGGGEEIATSSTSSFTTLLATPQLTSPVDNYSSTDRTPTLSWTQAASTSGVTYQLDYYFNGSSTATTVSGITTTSYTFPSDLPLGRYTWKITADDGTGKNTATTSVTRTFDVVPTLSAPVNGLTGVPIEPTFTWVAGGINTFIIQITTTSGNYSSPVVEKTVTGSNPTTYQMLESDTGIPLNNNTTYYWRLKVAAGSSTYIYSNEWQFKTWPNMTITHGWPTAGATVYTTSTTFSWAINSTTGSLKFKPQVVASTSTPSVSGWAAATLTTTTTSLTTSFSLNGGTQYYWRLVVLNSSNEVVAYSSPTTFTTSGGTNVTLYPSWPTGGNTVYTTTPTAYWYLDVYATGLTYQINYSTSSTTSSGVLSSGNTEYPSSISSFSSNQYITFPTLTPGQTYYWQVRAYYATTSSYSSWSSVASFTVNNTNAVVVPTPSYPTGGVTVYTTSPYLYWYLGTNSTGLKYDIDYATTSGGLDGTPEVNDATTLYTQLSGLTPGQTYYWRVRSDNGTTQSSWSSTQSFVVSGGVTGSAPVASWPTGNPTVYTTKPTLSWYLNGTSAGITGYKVKYSTSSQTWSSFSGGSPSTTSGEINVTGATNTTTTLTVDLTAGQTYYWAVASTDGSSFSAYSEGSFTIVGASSGGTPILSSPIGGVTVYSSSPTLYWYFNGTTTGIVGYNVHYSKTAFLSTDDSVTSAMSSTNTYVSLTGLTPGATYSWKVRAYYGGTTYGSYSTTETFVVDAGAAPVQPLIGGPNNVTISTSSPVVSWVLPVQSQSQLSYDLVYSTSEDMSNAQTIEGISSPFSSIEGLTGGETYYWKVRSVTNDGNYSDYSPRASFTTDQTTAVKDDLIIPDKFLVDQNYPNPFNPSTIIKFGIPNAEYVTVRIYNMLGQEVRTLLSKNVNAGTYEMTWNGKDNNGNAVTSGAYIYRVVAGNNSVTKKMMLLK